MMPSNGSIQMRKRAEKRGSLGVGLRASSVRGVQGQSIVRSEDVNFYNAGSAAIRHRSPPAPSSRGSSPLERADSVAPKLCWHQEHRDLAEKILAACEPPHTGLPGDELNLSGFLKRGRSTAHHGPWTN